MHLPQVLHHPLHSDCGLSCSAPSTKSSEFLGLIGEPSGHAPPWLKVGDPQVTLSALSPGPLSPPSLHAPSLSTLLPGWVAGFFLLQRMDDGTSKSLHHEKLILQATEHQSFGPHKDTENS